MTAYVCHVADNLRIWSERLMGVALGAAPEVAGYDENQLARARHYEDIPLESALWSLRMAVDQWVIAVTRSRPAALVLFHPERGRQTVLEVAQSNLHDARHHQWDIATTLRSPGPAD